MGLYIFLELQDTWSFLLPSNLPPWALVSCSDMPACHFSFWLPILLQSSLWLLISHCQTMVPSSFALFLKEVLRMAQFCICLSHCLLSPTLHSFRGKSYQIPSGSEFPVLTWILELELRSHLELFPWCRLFWGTAIATPVLLVFLLHYYWLPSPLSSDLYIWGLHLTVSVGS